MSWQDHLIQYRRDLHQIPEIGFEEYKTSSYLFDRLVSFGLNPRRIGDTGIVADITGAKPGKTYAVRADIDALPLPEETGLEFSSTHPGAMHACGHDAHMAIVLGLAERLTADRDFAGTVRILFQPAEEKPPGGALDLINGGALEGVDEVYGLHVWSNYPVGTAGLKGGVMMANADQFTIRIKGVGGHGSQPQSTKDAVLIAAQTVVNLQTVVSRRVGAFEPAVVTCGTIHAGHNFNIIAETAEITGTVRTFSANTQARIIEEIGRIATATAALYDASAELTYQKGYPALINHDQQAAQWEEKLRGLVEVVSMQPDPGGEDFAYYLQHRPGAFLFLGCGPEGKAAPHHSPHFLVDERVLPLGVEVLRRAISQ
jgi:amidohydrolase